MRPIGERIATIARRERGNKACGPNKVDGKGYFKSCENHHAREPWCADFAKWVWYRAKALHIEKLNAGAVSFAHYGRVRQGNPKVGDAVLFGWDKAADRAEHVAIVIRVLPGRKIVSIGGNEGPSNDTSVVSEDGPYDGAFGSWGPGAPNGPISGYISPVEDEMPYTKSEIRNLVKEGVAAAVKEGPAHQRMKQLIKDAVSAELTAAHAAQGAKAAVDADSALTGISQQLTALATQVAALSAATPPTTGNGPGTGTGRRTGTGPGTSTGRGTRTPTGTGTSGSAGTGQVS